MNIKLLYIKDLIPHLELLKNVVKNSYSYSEVLRFFKFSTHPQTIKRLRDLLNTFQIDTTHFSLSKSERIGSNNPFQEGSHCTRGVLRRIIIKNNLIDYKCAICEIKEWRGKKLTLRLDHVNGVNNDNRLENLRFVCPNCDSQLPTYCSNNRKVFEIPSLRKPRPLCQVCNRVSISYGNKSGTCSRCFNFKESGNQISVNSVVNIDESNTFKKEESQITIHKVRQFKIQWPNKEELQKLVWEIPTWTLAKQLGVSDKAIEKRCKKLQISKPPRGYWVKIKSDKT